MGKEEPMAARLSGHGKSDGKRRVKQSLSMISVVIPSYNRRDCIVRLLEDLRTQRNVEFEVIIVDDCSPDDTVKVVRERFPEVTVIVNAVNGGPCVSRNKGVLAASGDIIVGLDSDVSVADPHLLEKVASAFAAEPAVGFAFRIFCPDGVTDDAPRWWHPQPVGTACGSLFETDYFSGTAYAFRRAEMIAAGLYPEILYMHYEEVELAFRILDQGGVIQYRPELSVVHHANPVSRRNEISVFYKPRNQILLAVACLPVAPAVRYLAPRVTYQLFKACRGGHLGGFCRAMKSAAGLVPSLLGKRQPLKKTTLRRINDLRKKGAGEGAGTVGFREQST
jgi:GT2 family glycosyltransferase